MNTLILRALLVALTSGLFASHADAQTPRAPIRDPAHEVEVYIPSWKEQRERYVVMQKREYSCGAAAMATVLRYYWGDQIGEEDVLKTLLAMLTPEEIKDRIKNGLSIADLRRAAVKMGYQASVGTLSFENLAQSHVPLVVPLRLYLRNQAFDHFVVYRGIVDGRVYLADPVRGNVRPTIGEFCSQWQKNAILVIAKPDTEPPKASPLGIWPDQVHTGDMTQQMLRRQLPLPSLPPPSP